MLGNELRHWRIDRLAIRLRISSTRIIIRTIVPFKNGARNTDPQLISS